MRNICCKILISLTLSFLVSANCLSQGLEVGQILMVGFNEAVATPDLIAHLKKIKPGAIILFRRNVQNPQQLETLIHTLQRELNPVLNSPLLFAIDQEGGSVFRIPSNPRIPSPAALGKSNDPMIVEKYGYAIGKFLRRNGISMNLAPVLDLDAQVDRNFIGSRSFGADPSLVAQLGYLFSKGLASAGVVPTGKHFPGLGSVFTDPHEMTPVSELAWNTDWNRELLPFREFSRLTPSALMLSHVIYPKLDAQRLPASVSPYIIKSVLRDSLKYEGLIITDDLLMKGITSRLSPSKAALASLNSGADLVMLSWSRKDQLQVYEALKSAIQTHQLNQSELQEKITRIKKIKSLIGVQQSVSSGVINWESGEIRSLNKELLEKNLARDQSLYKRVTGRNVFYFYNLNTQWPTVLGKRFPQTQLIHLETYEKYQALSVEQKQRSLLFYGLNQAASIKTLAKLNNDEKANVVLIVTNDVYVDHPENFYNVFLPLWPFEGIASSVIKYL